jgi:molybdopterin molybdotransferase
MRRSPYLWIDFGAGPSNIAGMLELEEARRRILEAIEPLPPEIVPLHQAAGRVLAQDLESPVDLPPFDNSAMDGYAVRSSDTLAGSFDSPAKLKLSGRIPAGHGSEGILDPGTCRRIFTGAALPPGADAVLMQEDTRVGSATSDEVLCLDSVKAWENVRLQGEDVKRGSLLMKSGDRINAARMAFVAAVGIAQVTVGRQPITGLLATGSELVEAGAPLDSGKIYESNRVALAALLRASGARPKILPLVRDNLQATKQAMDEAFAECDAVVTSGGVSVGELDFIKPAFEQLGGSISFWKVAIKPGKPFLFGHWRGKLLFGLPGNPVSALVTFLLMVRPAVWRWQGASTVEPPQSTCVLGGALQNLGTRRHFMRVRIDNNGLAFSAGAQASHVLNSLAVANGLVDVPPNTTLVAGTLVPVIRFDD